MGKTLRQGDKEMGRQGGKEIGRQGDKGRGSEGKREELRIMMFLQAINRMLLTGFLLTC